MKNKYCMPTGYQPLLNIEFDFDWMMAGAGSILNHIDTLAVEILSSPLENISEILISNVKTEVRFSFPLRASRYYDMQKNELKGIPISFCEDIDLRNIVLVDHKAMKTLTIRLKNV